MAEGATVTAQPTKKVTVEVPNIDIDHLIQGNWQVKMTDCLTDPVVCELQNMTYVPYPLCPYGTVSPLLSDCPSWPRVVRVRLHVCYTYL